MRCRELRGHHIYQPTKKGEKKTNKIEEEEENEEEEEEKEEEKEVKKKKKKNICYDIRQVTIKCL